MVMANPRNETARISAIIAPAWTLSIESRKPRAGSPATLGRVDAPTPAVNRARMLTRKRRPLLYAAWRSTPAGVEELIRVKNTAAANRAGGFFSARPSLVSQKR